MRVLSTILGCALAATILFDVFKAVVLARRARGEFRLTDLFYRLTWPAFAAIGRKIQSGQKREAFLGIYGPLSLLLIFFLWAVGFIIAFTLLQMSAANTDRFTNIPNALYLSAASFLTIGAGNAPQGLSRWISVAEAGLGFSYLALVIGYLPVFYQSFARRELHISLLDARAGSPPSAGELIARQAKYQRQLERQLASWEIWAADLLQDELSYPMLAYFRSQHSNHSWIGTLVAITDTSLLVLLTAKDELRHQAEATFAMGRHALIDSSKVLGVTPTKARLDRLSPDDLKQLRQIIADSGLDGSMLGSQQLAELRALYESYASALSSHLLMALPLWIPKESPKENWRISSQKDMHGIFAVSDPFHDANAKDRSA